MKNTKFGIDVGNSDTKSMNTSTPSGLESYTKLPSMAKEWLLYDGKYYIPVNERMYQLDKTNSNFALILTLFGIAKETLFLLNSKGIEEDKYQDEISKMQVIDLGIGLPPGHLNLAEKTKQYYHEHLDNDIEFRFNNYHFKFKMDKLQVSPQGYAAVVLNNKLKIPTMFNSYYIIDIGGITIDVIAIINKEPDVKKCVSFEMGVLRMYDDLIDKVTSETQVVLDYNIIRSVLNGEQTILDDTIKESILDFAQEWTDRIINTLRQRGIDYNTYPCIFMGGGAKLYKKYIKRNALIKHAEYMPSANANAKGFHKLICGLK